jgi:hypothetical protein
MSWLREQWQRVKHLIRGGNFDRDLDEEMQLHLDLRVAERPEAKREARVRLKQLRSASRRTTLPRP